MYECATGRVPFDGDDAISVALKQVNEMPVPPSQINSSVDPSLERIILRCMEKDPANRFQSAEELRGVLNTYLSGRTVDVPEPTRRHRRRSGHGRYGDPRDERLHPDDGPSRRSADHRSPSKPQRRPRRSALEYKRV